MNVYEFTVKLVGVGVDEDEAWRDAVEAFDNDPGEPATAVEIKEDDND